MNLRSWVRFFGANCFSLVWNNRDRSLDDIYSMIVVIDS
jgi:hypothetical protein